MLARHARPTVATSLQIVAGLWIFGTGLAFVVRGANGQGAWTVFHDGLSHHTPLSIGGATVVTGLVILGLVVLMREPIGLGTVLNIAIIGPATDTTLWLLDEPSNTAIRVGLTIASPFMIAFGSSLYLGVHWGPGPRDGLMTGLNKRGVSIRVARFGIEFTAFVVGFLLGGAIGWGTVWAVVAIGPAVQWMLPWFDRAPVTASAG
ncbi:MAG: hypothetical protein AAGC53_19585 [Actinomycetota bacterium]